MACRIDCVGHNASVSWTVGTDNLMKCARTSVDAATLNEQLSQCHMQRAEGNGPKTEERSAVAQQRTEQMFMQDIAPRTIHLSLHKVDPTIKFCILLLIAAPTRTPAAHLHRYRPSSLPLEIACCTSHSPYRGGHYLITAGPPNKSSQTSTAVETQSSCTEVLNYWRFIESA